MMQTLSRRNLLLGLIANSWLAANVQATEKCGAASQDIAVGGTVLLSDLAEPSNTTLLRQTCRVRLYLHDYAWRRLPDDGARRLVLQAFKETGPTAVELGATEMAAKFWAGYKRRFTALGVRADIAHVNDSDKLSVAQWRDYVDAGREAGMRVIAPIFSPNSGQWRNAAFGSSRWADVHAKASYGGGLTVDSPPGFYLASHPGYQRFIQQELSWAKRTGLEATAIISPHKSGARFLRDTITMLEALQSAGTSPTSYIVENYETLPPAPFYLNSIGNEREANSVTSTTLWIAQNVPRRR